MTKPANHPPPIARVDISGGGRHVSVEAALPLATVKKTALDLWRSTESPSVPAAGSVLPADLTVPGRT